ncbi:MAG: hypothetical protein AB4352_17780 [Hormoscilla sp.]
MPCPYHLCQKIKEIANIAGCRRSPPVGARHPPIIGKDENVTAAVPRPHAIAPRYPIAPDVKAIAHFLSATTGTCDRP